VRFDGKAVRLMSEDSRSICELTSGRRTVDVSMISKEDKPLI